MCIWCQGHEGIRFVNFGWASALRKLESILLAWGVVVRLYPWIVSMQTKLTEQSTKKKKRKEKSGEYVNDSECN